MSFHCCSPDSSASPPNPLQGDWGTQFGMLIQYMAEKRPEGLNAATDEDVADLQVSARSLAGLRVGRPGSRPVFIVQCGPPHVQRTGSHSMFI